MTTYLVTCKVSAYIKAETEEEALVKFQMMDEDELDWDSPSCKRDD